MEPTLATLPLPTMHPVLDQLQKEIDAGVAGLGAAEMQLRPVKFPLKWSVQQVMEHLLLTYGLSCEAVGARVAKGTPTKVMPSLGQRVGQLAVLRCGYFPSGRAAPEPVMPRDDAEPLAGAVLAERAHDLLMRFAALAAEAEALFGSGRAISHLVLGPLSAMQWRRFHLAHGRHHLRQIAAIRAAHGL